MKLPYRAGDSFALPLGDGTHVPARIVACHHRIVEIAVAGTILRVYDDALVLRRWNCHPERSEAESREAPHALPSTTAQRAYARDDTVGPAHAERIVATRLGVADLALPPLVVHASAPYVPALPPIRDACELAAAPSDARALHITGRNALPDSALLARFARLEALRLVRIDAPVDLRAIAMLPLRTLSLEALREVRAIDALHRWDTLEQLEMLGFWQFTLDEVMPLVALPRLVRAEIDAGGRRKNAELYPRARWAYPWPFELAVRTNVSIARVASGSGSTQTTL